VGPSFMICSGVNGADSSACVDWSRAPLGDWAPVPDGEFREKGSSVVEE
jgi:hypothetical protein